MAALRDVAASMVAPGKGVLAADESIGTMSKRLAAAGVPASETVLRAMVPADVPGIAFLSGGRSNEQACANLAAINAAAHGWAPWRLTYSFGRALVSDALHAWRGDPGRVKEAQAVLAANCARASAVNCGAPGTGDSDDG